MKGCKLIYDTYLLYILYDLNQLFKQGQYKTTLSPTEFCEIALFYNKYLQCPQI